MAWEGEAPKEEVKATSGWEGEAPNNNWDVTTLESPKPQASLLERLSMRGRNIGKIFTQSPPEGQVDKVVANAERTLNLGGQIAGGVNDVIGSVVSPVVNNIQKLASANVPTPDWNPVPQMMSKAYESVQSLKKEYPRATENIGAAGNIASLLPIGAGSKRIAENTPYLKETVGEIAGGIEKHVAKTVEQEAIDLIRPDFSIMSKQERINAAKKGTVEKSSIFKNREITVTNRDKEIAKSVEDVVSKKADPSENIAAIRDKIIRAEEPKTTLLEQSGVTVNKNDLANRLSQAKKNSEVVFGTDKTLESAYDSVVTEFMKLYKNEPDTLAGVLNARKKLDDVIERKFGFDKLEGDNVRKNALKDVRMAANDFIAESLPEGNPFKSYLKEQSNMYRGIDRIAEKIGQSSELGVLKRVTNMMRRHPYLTAEAGASLGVAGHAIGIGGALGSTIVGIVSNPVAIAGLLTYGTYRIGKMIVTSKDVQTGLASFLRGAEKSLTGQEYRAVDNLIKALGPAPTEGYTVTPRPMIGRGFGAYDPTPKPQFITQGQLPPHNFTQAELAIQKLREAKLKGNFPSEELPNSNILFKEEYPYVQPKTIYPRSKVTVRGR